MFNESVSFHSPVLHIYIADENIEVMTEELTRLRVSEQFKVTQSAYNETVEKLQKAEGLISVLKQQTVDLVR